MDDDQIGEIKRTFSNEKKDYFSNDDYVATFPLSLDVKLKAILMTVMILMVGILFLVTFFTQIIFYLMIFIISVCRILLIPKDEKRFFFG